MSENLPRPQTQKERWLKYGANVGLMTIIVILLAVFLTWLAQSRKASARIDTTSAGLYSLKPQTINLIKDNTQKIRIVSLYTRTKADNPDAIEVDTTDYVQPVEDLLNEYERKGKNIEVQVIDPVSQPSKVDQLIADVTSKYGGEVQKYKAVVDEYPEISKKISALADGEVKQVQKLPPLKVSDVELYKTLILTISTIQEFPKQLQDTQKGIDRGLKQRPPDYKGAVDSIRDGMSELSLLVGVTIDNFKKFKDDAKVPEELRKYMAQSLPNYEQLQKLADDLKKRIGELGELKLDDLKQSLRARDTILVMGANDMRVIPRDKVWVEVADVRFMQSGGKPKMRFAGEQQVTSAILAVTSKSKPKVAFVRGGGPPLTTPGIPGFMRPGEYSMVAERLRDYNFDVLEKDLSGMWAMQAQMQGSFAPPEPTDEQIKDAIWVVVDLGQPRRNPMQPPPSLGPKVAEHLKNGGSALLLSRFNSESFGEALDEWGIKVRTDAIAVHQPVESPPGGSSDFIQQALRIPYIFLISEYGDHMLTKPLRSLDSALVPLCVVQTEKKDGYDVTPILPVPQKLKTWGETDVMNALENAKVSFDKPGEAGGDLAPPLYGGAVGQKKDGGRVVVVGCADFPVNGLVGMPDPDLLQEQRIIVPRFPGNAELFMNSIFWLARMDPMIAISPAAMEVNRIADMSGATLNFWRIGVLLVGLPGLVLVGGLVMYMSRRD